MKKILILVLIIGIAQCWGKGQCTNAYCGNQVKACNADSACDSNRTKCAQKYVSDMNKKQNPSFAQMDWEYCMKTNKLSRELLECSLKFCKSFLQEDIVMEEQEDSLN